MERIQNIKPERIKWCCKDYGVTPEELARELDIAGSSMEKALSGEPALTFNQLRKMAEFFGHGVLFFLEDGPINPDMVHTPQFRTLANQKPQLSINLKKLIERVERQRKIYLGLLEELEFTKPKAFTPPPVDKGNLKATASNIREWLKLGDNNSFTTYREAVESVGVLVFRSNGYAGKWKIPEDDPVLGFSLYYRDYPVIMVKKNNPEARQCFTLMHELGHLILDKKSFIDEEEDLYSHDGAERDANALAGYVLVPDAFLNQINDADRPNDVSEYKEWLRQVKDRWGVSTEVILRRLLDEKRLSKQQYRDYRNLQKNAGVTQRSMGTRKYRHREPVHIFGGNYVRTVLSALNTERITLVKATSYLDDLKVKDLHKLEGYYANL